jgi:hypothetical protein
MLIHASTLMSISHNKTNKCTNVKITFLHTCVKKKINLKRIVSRSNAVSINYGPLKGTL